MNTIYNTENLNLRVLEEKDAAKVLDYYKRNKEFHREWMNERSEEFFTLECTRTSLIKDYDLIDKGELFRLWIFKKEDLTFERVIGTIGFSAIVRGAFLSCFLGYMMDKDEINNGYVTEAIQKGIEIMFNEYRLHRIEANIMPKNHRSLKVVQKLGFVMEGISEKYLHINGKWEDHIHMVLLNKELE